MGPITNIHEAELMHVQMGTAFESRVAGHLGHRMGMVGWSPRSGLDCTYYIVEPGKKALPFMSHHQIDEVFFVLEGEGTYRFGLTSFPVKAGDVCAAPSGSKEHAHQLINTGNVQLKYIKVSTKVATNVSEFPDSGKFGVNSLYDWHDQEGVNFIGRVGQQVDYLDGEK